MADLVCKYCGKAAQNVGSALRAGGSDTCNASPTKKHVAVSTGQHCVFCGKEAKNVGSNLRAGGSDTCNASPSKKHQLAD